MAVVCHNCKSADIATGGGELLNCLNCGHVLNQDGSQPDGSGDFPTTWTGLPREGSTQPQEEIVDWEAS